jgi:hypothetical protein
MEEVPPLLELVPALPDEPGAAVTAAVAELMRGVFLAGRDLIDWVGMRVGSPRPGVVTLALPSGAPDAEARLRELARRVASPTVSAVVIPAA